MNNPLASTSSNLSPPATKGFQYTPLYNVKTDDTSYRCLTNEGISSAEFEGKQITKVSGEALELLAKTALSEVNYFYRSRHLEGLRHILDDKEASDNDHYIALSLLKNAVIASGRVLPSCQDTGTAKVFGLKGQRVWTDINDAEALSRGIYTTYHQENLRYSQNVPLSLYEEKNTLTNLPAQIDILATEGNQYHFLFMAKGGGSANKMLLFQETKAILSPERLPKWVMLQMSRLGTSACPPYHLALVIGGTSAENTMKTLTLASAGFLDGLPSSGNSDGYGFRDLAFEKIMLDLSYQIGIGAQFGGKYFAHSARVIRLPRHGASLPIGLGVSCSADRNIKGKITSEGVFLEELDHDPARFLPQPDDIKTFEVTRINLNQPMENILNSLAKYPVKTRILLNGKMIVARDIAHARFRQMLESGQALPDYLKKHPIYYAGPAKTPSGYTSGSFGPTTAGRMDDYVELLQAQRASMVMLAKGNRSQKVTNSCQQHGGFYLGSMGGPAALLAKEHISSVRPLDFVELGMEAVWEIEVKDFPAFIVIDNKGNDFYAKPNN